MSTIPTNITQEQFEEYIRPCLKVAQRGYECKIPLYKVFNYILYRLHTGCQWGQLPITADPDDSEKKKLVIKQCTIIGKNGVEPAVLRKFGIKV